MTSLEVNYGNQRAFNFAAGDGAVSLLIIPNDSIVIAIKCFVFVSQALY